MAKKGSCPHMILLSVNQYFISNNNCMHSNLWLKPLKTILWLDIVFEIQKIYHITLIPRGAVLGHS